MNKKFLARFTGKVRRAHSAHRPPDSIGPLEHDELSLELGQIYARESVAKEAKSPSANPRLFVPSSACLTIRLTSLAALLWNGWRRSARDQLVHHLFVFVDDSPLK
jgi:hypothetical protein